jgi:hypothetical protein
MRRLDQEEKEEEEGNVVFASLLKWDKSDMVKTIKNSS